MFTLTPIINDDLLRMASEFLPPSQSADLRRVIRNAVGAVLIATGSATATPHIANEESLACTTMALRDPALRAKLPQGSIATASRFASSASRSSSITFSDVCRAAVSLQATDVMLTNVYNLVLSGQTRKAMVAIFRAVNDAMVSDGPPKCDQIISTIDLTKLDSDTILAVLASTYPAKSELPSRSSFYNKAMVHLVQGMGAARAHDVADRMK